MNSGPALVSILRQGDYLIASIHTALDDSQMVRFQRGPRSTQIGRHRARGVIIDVAAALDVMDSFASRTLRDIAEMARLRGARTVIVGIQPDVAFAMVQLGMDTGSVATALDLEEGLAYLAESVQAPTSPVHDRPSENSQRDYRAAFLRYLPRRDEVALNAGYELGRAGLLAREVSMLDVAHVHHDVLVEVLRASPAERSLWWPRWRRQLEVLAGCDMSRRPP